MAPTANLRSTQRTASASASAQSANQAGTASPTDLGRRVGAPEPVVDSRATECPECSGEIAAEDGDVYCVDCALVLSEQQLERSEPEWREYEDRRLGPQQSKQWLNIGSDISQTGANADRLRTYHERLQNRERSLADGLREVRSLSAGVELPNSTRERAAYLYRKVVQDDLLKGRTIEGFAAACVFVAAREQRQPMTVERLAEFSPLPASKIRHHQHVLHQELSIQIAPAQPQDYLPLVASRLAVETAIERRANDYLERASEEGIHIGKKPSAIAATAVYAAATDAGLELTQEEIAAVADTSAITISRRYQEIRGLLEEA